MSLHCFFIAARQPEPAHSEVDRFSNDRLICNGTAVHSLFAVIPAKAGTQTFAMTMPSGIPAFAGTMAEIQLPSLRGPMFGRRVAFAHGETTHVAR
ncbi:hypothetical protein [Lysobacter hankyongensis]|uniref:hypothetical protein n=1 Tax=Lysobacter hankyongensis TaxID=1176535 RepID=UPI0031EEE410